MSYDKHEKPSSKFVQPRQIAGASRRPIAPGKRTLTQGLRVRPAVERTPVQQKPDPQAEAQRTERAELTAQWMNVALRPDLHSLPVQRKSDGEGRAHTSSLPTSGGGQPLPEDVRAKMEGAFGTDFSGVRIHQGPQATRMGALAYTQGTDIHFAPGQYDPTSQRGQELLGHELTHAVQQSQGRVGATTQAKGVAVNDDQGLEREADEIGRKAAAGVVVSGSRSPGSRPITASGGPAQRQVVQRQQAPQGAGSVASPGAAADIGATESATDELGTLLAALQNPADATGRQTATIALTTWCREHLVDRDRLRTYLQSNVDNETKTRIMGELRAEIGRNEFLLGWSYEGGVTAGGVNGWENDGANQGMFPDHYLDEVDTSSAGAQQPWCTSFAGYTAARLGFEAAPGATSTSMFWSGYRLDRWARTGLIGQNTQATPQAQTVAAEGNSSVIITGDEWRTLYTTLNRLHQNRPAGQSDAEYLASQQQAVDEFLAEHTTPQAGDMFVYDGNNRVHGGSHTNMVERYDTGTRTIYTIGGNEGHAVGGRRVVLTDHQQVQRLASMVRIGAEFYTGLTGAGAATGVASGSTAGISGQPATTAGAPDASQQPTPASPAQAVSDGPALGSAMQGAAGGAANAQLGPELVHAARDVNTRIAAVLHGSGQLQSNAASATVLEWQTGSTTTNASTSDN